MYDTCIIILVLSGIALVANVAVCLYTLHITKQAEHKQYMKGYVKGLLHSQISPADEEQQRWSVTSRLKPEACKSLD